jgi:hypothetical protein
MKKASLLLLLFASLFGADVAAQNTHPKDKSGSADHPMFNRMSNFYIRDYSSAFDACEFYLAGGKQ